MSGTPTIFTIGHSNHELPEFLRLLTQHGVTAVADVRSQPYGRLDHFYRENIEASLKSVGMSYVFLGQELGARRDERECYIGDQADYDRIALLPAFVSGLERLERGSKTHVIVLMCAEKDPLDCHRMVLVSRALSRRGWNIAHILADGELESHADAQRRLVRKMGIERTLFEPDLGEDELIEQAYDKRAKQIAYRITREGAVE
jgi:uncharacterized protein (DUF488 family)